MARVRSSGVVELDIQADAFSGGAHDFVGMQVDLLVLDRAPAAFDEDVVALAAFAVHRGADTVCMQNAGEGTAGELGGFNRSSQHPSQGGVRWDDRRMSFRTNRASCDALARATASSSAGREARILGTHRGGLVQRGSGTRPVEPAAGCVPKRGRTEDEKQRNGENERAEGDSLSKHVDAGKPDFHQPQNSDEVVASCQRPRRRLLPSLTTTQLHNPPAPVPARRGAFADAVTFVSQAAYGESLGDSLSRKPKRASNRLH